MSCRFCFCLSRDSCYLITACFSRIIYYCSLSSSYSNTFYSSFTFSSNNSISLSFLTKYTFSFLYCSFCSFCSFCFLYRDFLLARMCRSLSNWDCSSSVNLSPLCFFSLICWICASIYSCVWYMFFTGLLFSCGGSLS